MKIEWTAKAIKQVEKFRNNPLKQKLFTAVEAFANGGHVDIIVLVNHHYTHRIRVGDYRILLTIAENEIEVSYVEEVKKRDDNTY
jgi:mRNA-degrading endonuclease RelE of RelBE toxin-antitoxin system